MAQGLFNFHAVGQGLFYTGRISSTNLTYNFIFDIGTLSSQNLIQAQIDRYVTIMCSNNEDIDCLILSHVDRDHLSGLIYLMNSLSTTNIKIKNIIFPAHPASWLLSKVIKSHNISPYLIEDNDQLITIQNSLFNHIPFWKFDMHFSNTINKSRQFKKTNNSINKRKPYLLNFLKNKQYWTPQDLQNLTKILDRITGNKNRNSSALNLIHGPLFFGNSRLGKMSSATLLTSDSNWKKDENEFRKWLQTNGWQPRSPKSIIQYMQMPHHGSIKNWEISKSIDYDNIPFKVFTTGYRKNWNHPHSNVISSLGKNSKIIIVEKLITTTFTYDI